MNKIVELFENAIIHWRDARGKGTALIPAPLNDKVMILGILQRMYIRSPTCDTVIIVDSLRERVDIIEFLTHQEEEENNIEFKNLIKDKHIKIFTFDFILRNKFNVHPFLTIIYHPNSINNNVENYLFNSKFKLVILNKLELSSEDMIKLYKVCPLLDDFKQQEVDAIRSSTPVEEVCVPIDIPDNSNAAKILKTYNEYITTTFNIFGSFDIMQQARTGNQSLNISAAQVCNQIAQENGWNPHLDMNIDFNREIDALYNPISLRDRAAQTYEFIRNRSQFLSDYDDKLEKILDIVRDNPDSKILIINKRGEFANKVTEYLNSLSETSICANYHDRVDNIPAIDENGTPLYYKSGTHKGDRRMMGAKMQQTLNERFFNRGDIRVLSTNNSPNKELDIAVDIIIITSPQCETIESYIYRLSNLRFSSNKISLYTLYCRNTMEERMLDNRTIASTHKIISKCEKTIIDENNSDFVVAD